MSDSEQMSFSLQENVLTLLCFDSEAAAVISGVVSKDYFDSAVYRNVARKAIEFYQKFKRAPKVHIADLLEDDLSRKGKQSQITRRVLNDIYALHEDGINAEYVMSRLREFVRVQRMKTGILDSARLVNDGKVDEAESVMLTTLRAREQVFAPGLTLFQAPSILTKLEQEMEVFRMGIPPLDDFAVGPARKTLLTVMAPTNRGKSWMLTHLAKHAMLQRLKVLHVTLEMSEAKTMARYLQALFGLRARYSATGDTVRLPVLDKYTDDDGRLVYSGHSMIDVERPALFSDAGKALVKRNLEDKNLKSRFRLVVKEFPPSSLSTMQLRGYLDMLEQYENFVPDVIIVDYADLMDIDVQHLRVDTGRVYKELRGLGVERNAAVVTASQTNRQGEDAKVITLTHTAEDYSKAATSDVVITYNQTQAEKALGLARLFVAKGRDDRSGMVCVVAQGYGIGQFHMDSTMIGDYGSYLMSVNANPSGEGEDAGIEKGGRRVSRSGAGRFPVGKDSAKARAGKRGSRHRRT